VIRTAGLALALAAGLAACGSARAHHEARASAVSHRASPNCRQQVVAWGKATGLQELAAMSRDETKVSRDGHAAVVALSGGGGLRAAFSALSIDGSQLGAAGDSPKRSPSCLRTRRGR